MKVWLGLMLICGMTVMPDAESIIGSFLRGRREVCSNEGEIVPVESIKCFTCMCKFGFVECRKEQCPSLEGCHMILDQPNDRCCRKCKGCMHRGIERNSGEEWRDPENPCKVYICQAGVITKTEEKCHVPCSKPLAPLPGQCCHTCPGCIVNGQLVSDGRTVRSLEDPCLKCQCSQGKLSCSKKACPVLHCISGAIQKPQHGECCPTCRGSRDIFTPPQGRCLLGSGIHNHGVRFKQDHCTECQCLNGTSFCSRESCPVLDCPREWQIPGKCCPQCRPDRPPSETCTYSNKTFKDGDSWKLDQCRSCVCKAGQVKCAAEVCNNSNIACPPYQKRIKLPGQCCPICVESDGVCTIFGDPHYKTFDGKFFSFQGSCKYLLTSDCSNKTFSIRVTNDARETKTSSWTKTVTIKLNGVKVNLGERRRVKINGVRVAVPYKSWQVKVTNSEYSVLVETDIGVKVLWDGNSFLEVSVPPSYKGKLCGLCGNFNSISRDDMMTKKGRIVTDPDEFGMSWKVGGKRACTRLSDTHSHCSQYPFRKKPKDKLCKPLKSELFAPCHKKLNYLMYYKSCLADICECPRPKCYCESFTAYAHECQRLGVKLPDWRAKTDCFPWR